MLKKILIFLLSLGFAVTAVQQAMGVATASNELVEAITITNTLLAGLGLAYVNLNTMNWFH
ncbi:MAG: hypothetical protein CL398_09380 [Acidiferrobacteraceae bacterium]|nr:hypothetical protein [Acidiferrobacteraceae bacterium]|tara:strand:+ start:132 stop:314 length:183 start_codon:yes stop_codon:yes gene_type:complete